MPVLKSKEKKDQLLKPAAPAQKRKTSKPVKIILIVLFAAFVCFGIYCALENAGYMQTLRLAWQIQKQSQLSANDQKILSELGEIMLLPKDITPTMAVVTDVLALRKIQPDFFANAKNGDRMIFYPDQTILFDADAGKIIKVGVVEKTKPVNFAVYNGTSDESATAEMEKTLKAAFNNAAVIIKENAAGDYKKTLVVDLLGNNPEIEQIAEAIGGEVAPLPEGEKKPEEVAVLVIVGSEK